MPTRRAPRLAIVIGLLTTIAMAASACSGSAATSAPTQSGAPPSVPPGVSSSPTPAQASLAPTSAVTGAPSSAPSTTVEPAAPSFVLPSFTSDKELEADLPDTYKGVQLTKFSISGAKLFTDTSPSTKEFLALLQSLGKTPADVSFAIASDPTGKLGVSFGAYRIKGADAGTWAPTLYQIGEKDVPGATATDVNLGGKSVSRLVSPKTTQITYAWARGDVLFIVNTTNDALAGDAIAAIP